MKYLLALALVTCFSITHSVEKDGFSLSRHIEELFNQINKNEQCIAIKKLFTTQLKSKEQEENPELFFVFCQSLQNQKNYGSIFQKLEEIANENLRLYLLTKESQATMTTSWVQQQALKKTPSFDEKSDVKIQSDNTQRNLAIQQVLTLIKIHLEEK